MAEQSLSARIAQAEAEGFEESMSMWGGDSMSTGSPHDLVSSPKFKEIVAILHHSPILVEPVLKWLKVTQAALATAQLEVLYTPEQLQQMAEQLQSSGG